MRLLDHIISRSKAMPDQPDVITRLRKMHYILEDLPETIASPQRAGNEPREPQPVAEAIQDPEIIESEDNYQGVDAFDLEWLEVSLAHSERIMVRWGRPAGARAWSQWAARQEKEIIELRMERREPPFPGFSRFMGQISEIPSLPEAWRGALASVRGIYLLVSEAGEQYVGSATGQEGLLGRWLAYAANGHGGNVLLRARGHRDYAVSILEVASPDMSKDDILAREAHWKDKLGARAHGLNQN